MTAKPTLHTNGTHPDDLLEAYVAAYRAVGQAIEAVQAASPNGRDYCPQPGDAIGAAIAEQRARLEKLNSVAEEMLALAEHVSDNQPPTGPLSPRKP